MKTLPAMKLGPAMLVLALVAGCGGKSDADAMTAARQALAKRDLATAVIELKSVLQRTPQLGEARFMLGAALLEQGDHAAALLELRKAQELNFSDDALAPKLARALLAGGKFKEVVQAYAGVTPKDSAALAELSTAMAVAYARLDQKTEADAAVARALSADPKYPWALLTKARFFAAIGRFDEALALTDQAVVPGSPSGDAHILRGMLLGIAKKDTAGAAKAYELAAADPQEALAARGLLIQLLLGQGKLPEAKTQLVSLQKSHPKSIQTNYLAAVVAFADKDYALAESIADQLLRLAPDSAHVLVLGGAASLQRGALLAAESKLGKVVQTVERMAVARKLLAETYLRMGQPEKSLSTLRPLLEQSDADAGALALAGQAHLQAGHASEAEAMFSAAVKIKPDDVQVRTALALTELAKGRAAAAFDALEGIAATDPGETADLALISAHLRRQQHDEALAAIARLEKKRPGTAGVSHLRGLALNGKGDKVGARSAFGNALKVQPDHFASISAMVALDLQDGKVGEARQRLESAIKSNPKNTTARLALLDVLARQGATPSVLLASIDEAIRADPTDGSAHVAKISYLSKINDVKGAASAAQQAMAALPQHAEVLDAAGRALANSGDDQQAISAFNRMSSLLPRSALPHLRLADVYRKRGESTAVRSSLNRALEAAPLSPEVHKRLVAEAMVTKDYKGLIAVARGLQKRFEASAAGYILEGDAEAARRSWPAAVAAYRAALRKPDSAGRPQRLVYATLKAAGDKPGAERFAADWLKSSPGDAGFLEHLGGEALLRRNYSVAESYFRRVQAQQPKNGAVLNNLAWLMAERGEKGAVQLAQQSAALSNNAPPVLDTLAKALASEGRILEAIDTQSRVVAAMPDRHVYRLHLARLLIAGGKTSEASIELDTLAKLGTRFAQHSEVVALRSKVGK